MLKSFGIAAVSAMALTMIAGPAMATEGLYPHGAGARHKALGGGGIADGRDGTVQTLNPAGLTYILEEHETSTFSIAGSLFSPQREFSVNGQLVARPTSSGLDSESNFFVIPNLAFAMQVDLGVVDVVGFAVSALGGMNTDFSAAHAPFGNNVRTGINYEALQIQFSAAKKIGPVSIGFQPIAVRQTFQSEGFAGFGIPDKDQSIAWGWGYRVGAQVDLGSVRMGASYASRVRNQPFTKHRFLFANGGDVDLPAEARAGVAVDLNHHLTVMLDYRWINYEGVPTVGGVSDINTFIAGQGISFGWSDTHAIKVAVELDEAFELLGKDVTLRAGYSYNTSPLNNTDSGAFFTNIMAPATIQHHLTAGAMIEGMCGHHCDVELTGMFAPTSSIKNAPIPTIANTAFAGSSGTVDSEMWQFEITAGVTWKFGHEDDE